MSVATCWPTLVTLPEGPYPDIAVEARLRFDSSSPYAVCLAFPQLSDGDGEENQWYFARDLLNEGRCSPVGCGDVTVAPHADGHVLVTLRARDEKAVISIPGEVATAFLQNSFELVPAGSESDHLDIESVLARMLC